MQEFFAVASVHFLAVAAPGQDFAWVVRQSLKNGRGHGLTAALGISLGVFIFCLASLFGLKIVLRSFPSLIDLAKVLGAGYLFWVGWQMKKARPLLDVPVGEVARESLRGVFAQSCLVNLSNIKAIIFFLMVFSTIVSPRTATGIRLFYAVWMSVITFFWFAFVAFLFGNSHVRRKFVRHAWKIEVGTGWLFMVLAALVVFDGVKTFGSGAA